MNKLHVKAKDKIMVISGADAGKVGTVKAAYPKTGRVVVEGRDRDNAMTMMTKHLKPRNAMQPGGRIEMDRTIHATNVMLYCEKCRKPTRLAHKRLDDGAKVRVCKHCGEVLNQD